MRAPGVRARSAGGRPVPSSFGPAPPPHSLPHLCLLRSQPAHSLGLLQGPGRREIATSGSLSMPPLDWCPGSQTLMDPEALPVLGELAEPDPAARPLPSLLAVICSPLGLTPSRTVTPHPPPKPPACQHLPSLPRGVPNAECHASGNAPEFETTHPPPENPWVSPGAERARDGPSRAAVWSVRPGGRMGRPCARSSCVCVNRGHLTRDPQQPEKSPPIILRPASWATVL